MLTIALTIPPLLLGVAAFKYNWPSDLLRQLQEQPSQTLPMLLQYVTPPVVALLGLGAIVGAVTSSFSSSILSAASMFSWNCCYRLLWPQLSVKQMKRIIRGSIVLLGACAVIMALTGAVATYFSSTGGKVVGAAISDQLVAVIKALLNTGK